MPYTPKENKIFLVRLIAERSLPFEEVIGIFADAKGRISRSKLEAVLTTLWVEDTFVLIDRDGREASWKQDAVYDSPADYVIKFQSIDGKENSLAARFQDRIDEQDVTEIEPGYCWAGVKRREPLRIYGRPADAMLLAERIRAFTHYFAFHLVSRNYAKIEELFSNDPRRGHIFDDFANRVANVEKEYGPFEHFDHVEVMSVNTGDTADSGGSEAMKLPAGVERGQRSGEATFQIISVYTPNGMFVNEYTVQLQIIVEEDGFFRVRGASVHSGY